MTSAEEPFVEFRRLELRLGTVTEVGDHPEAEKLYVLKVDIGEDEPRTVVTNIKPFYPPEKLKGARILIIANLKPANFRGVKSFGMIVAADDGELGGKGVSLLKPTSDVPDGTLMDCGLGTLGLRAEMKHVEKVVMRTGHVSGGCFSGIPVDAPEGCPAAAVAVIDGDKAMLLSDGKGCFMVADSEVKDGAPAL